MTPRARLANDSSFFPSYSALFSAFEYPLRRQILNNNQVLFGYNFMPNNKFDYAQRTWGMGASFISLWVCVPVVRGELGVKAIVMLN